MKKILLILLLIPSLTICQNLSDLKNIKLSELDDKELLSYWKQAQNEGYSLNEIKTLARVQGISQSEINEFEKRINNLKNKQENNNELKSKMDYSSDFGQEIDELVKSSNKNILPIFGSNFFNNKNINSSPQFNIATPASYELGPGDEILISVWGSAENEYSSKISREGYVRVERIGPVYVSGLTINEAKEKLKRSLSKIYSGLNQPNESKFKVYIDLSLINSRSIVVNVTGNVVAPDTYTISSLASTLNVLYAAGGPSESGSYRNIHLIRDGKKIKTIDLYDYFSSGKLESFSLRDQDIILVPSYENRVFINGEFKNTGVFEFKNNENLNDLILYSGGISSYGFKDMLFIKRIDGINRKIDNVKIEEYANYKLEDGDIIEARPVAEDYTNLVTIGGSVFVPGEYSIVNYETNVNDLITKAGGLRIDAIKERGYIVRKYNGIENEIIPFKVSDSLSDIKLKANDKIIISSYNDINIIEKVSIEGEVAEAGEYPFYQGMTVGDLLLISKGVTNLGDLDNIQIYRSTYDENNINPFEKIEIKLNSISNFNENNNFKLKKDDLVIVRKKPGHQEKEFVQVDGLVKKPGIYAILNNKYSFYELINDFGGFLPNASINGVKIIRINELYDEADKLDAAIEIDSLKTKVEVVPFIEFGINVDKLLETKGQDPRYNIILKSGDQINVPKEDSTIEISGAVQQVTAINYSKSLTVLKAIRGAGGFKQNAKSSDVYVVYQNGDISATKNFLFFKSYPNLKPGAKIIVPEKNTDISNKVSVAEIVGYTTSLVSIIALIKGL